MEPIENVDFIQGDFREDSVLAELYTLLDNAPIDLVMSDMAPNMSGNASIDLPRSIYLGELALETARTILTNPSITLQISKKIFRNPMNSIAYKLNVDILSRPVIFP
jgi:23S rRNA (uridine2552-2'-O)-methyltransferase